MNFQPIRRRLLAALLAAPLLAAVQPGHAAEPVVVMTSYPDAVVSRFEAAFNKLHPELRLQFVWRMPHDALPYLEKPGNGVDVYWSASPRTYARLAAEGAFAKLDLDRSGLPEWIGKTRLDDPKGYWIAPEMAGYGYAIQPQALAALGVAAPKDWPDLADPRLAGRIALPIPARVGFAPVLVDIVLQSSGWERGWALWAAIADQSVLVDRGANFVSDEVASGRCAVGLSIDFFVASAIANGARLDFVYPAHGGMNPASLAIMAQAPNPAGAKVFAEFVMSGAGQRLLTHPDIRKLPVRPAVYADLPADYPRPFEAAARGAYDYDNAAGRERLALVTALFQQMLVERHARRVELRTALQAAKTAGRDVAAAEALLDTPPLSAAQAADPQRQALFRNRLEGGDSPANAQEKAWLAATDASLAKAAALLGVPAR